VTRVEILMATKDGAGFLPAQLASIAAQRGVAWRIVTGDDGSRDGTRGILAAFAGRTGRLRCFEGPGQGAAANFQGLLAGPPVAGLTALADQDDIWRDDRLARAAEMLGPWDHPEPRLYASRTMLVDARGRSLGPSPRLRRAPGFRNALVQNVLAGNTMVMNAAARDLLRRAAPAANGVPFHDWWVYALLTGAGARVIFDDRPGLFYRQHAHNVVGAHHGLRASLARLGAVANGRYGDWLRRNAMALSRAAPLLRPGARDDLARFTRVFAASPRARLVALAGSGARRQGRAGTLCVFGAAALGRL